MALDPRKRQKKTERKKAKDKARHKTLAVRQAKAVANRFDRAGQGLIVDSFVSSVLSEEGMGSVVLAREAGPGRVAFAVFLVDAYCLGVKDAIFDIQSRLEYRKLREKIIGEYEIEQHPPEYIRKLVEDAVEYARSLGFEPHPDYQRAKAIFGDLDASACREQFEFGREGKPFFISGPTDTPARCNRIVHTLMEHCGEGNFDYLLQLSERDLMAARLSQFAPSEGLLDDGDDSADDDFEGLTLEAQSLTAQTLQGSPSADDEHEHESSEAAGDSGLHADAGGESE